MIVATVVLVLTAPTAHDILFLQREKGEVVVHLVGDRDGPAVPVAISLGEVQTGALAW